MNYQIDEFIFQDIARYSMQVVIKGKDIYFQQL